jgi:hypothetical protein
MPVELLLKINLSALGLVIAVIGILNSLLAEYVARYIQRVGLSSLPLKAA